MSSNIRITIRNIGMSLAITLAVTAGAGAFAADAPPAVARALDTAQKPLEEVEQLDEIWVRGKLLSEVIEDAEDDFFRLYNRLNKNKQYEIFCGVMALNNGTMALVRQCVPGFIVYNYSNVFGGVSLGGGCNSTGFVGGSSYAISCSGNGYGGDIAGYVQPPAELMLMEKRKDYLANVLKVINSDPRLVDKIKGLDGLYKQMEQVQGRYVKVKGVSAPAPREKKSVRTNAGPRVL